MGIMTSEAYLASLAKQKPVVYIGGEKIHDVVHSPYFRISLEEMCKFYDWANDERTAADFTFRSHLIDDRVSFWTHLRETPEDVRRMIEVMKARWRKR